MEAAFGGELNRGEASNVWRVGASGMAFWPRLKAAIGDGVILATKVAIVLGVLVLTMSYLLGDYNVVRHRARNGQAAFEYIQQIQAQQAKRAKPEAPEGK